MKPSTCSPTKSFLLILFGLYSVQGASQASSSEQMAKISFMIGDWEGVSTTFLEKGSKEVKAHEVVQYKVDKHLITLDLDSETLKLHTVIYYDEEEQTYYYCPYYKKGTGKYRGRYEDGKFLVSFSGEKRLVFQQTPEGYFHEYGEKLQEGAWVKYFEDILPPKEN